MELIPKSGLNQLFVYEAGRPLEEVAREFDLDPSSLHKLASNENLLGPSPKAIQAMREAAKAMHWYPDGSCFYLKQAMAQQLELTPDRIVLGNGSNELIELLGHVFLEPGTGIVMSEQAFIIYKLVADLFGAETTMVPTRQFTHDLSAMSAAVNASTRLVFVSNPNNPTGTMVDNRDLERFARDLPRQTLLVLDEAYIELVEPERRPDAVAWLGELDNLCILRTFSKAYGLAGLRLGYALAHADLTSLLDRVRQPFNANAMAQTAALAALKDDDHLTQSRKLVRDGLETVVAACRDLGLETVPSVTNFLLVKTGSGRDMFQRLQREGVIVRPMDGYGLPDYIRVTVGKAEDNRALVEALGRAVHA